MSCRGKINDQGQSMNQSNRREENNERHKNLSNAVTPIKNANGFFQFDSHSRSGSMTPVSWSMFADLRDSHDSDSIWDQQPVGTNMETICRSFTGRKQSA